MEQRAKDLIANGDKLFAKRQSLLSLWQEIALNFYVERADFTYTRSLGDEFADHLTNSFPLLCRRDLGNSFSGMLRPRDRVWAKTSIAREDRLDGPGRLWLQMAGDVQRRAMYARPTNFIRATREGDHDFAAFGQCVISVELNSRRDDLLYRCWHLRDVAWCEDAEGKISEVHRKWKPTARDLIKTFPKAQFAQAIKTASEKEPHKEFEVRNVVVRAEDYDTGKKWRTPFVDIVIDVENGEIIEETGIHNAKYVIPRWQTVSGSQYAHSPATVIALPDARLIQAMTLTLLEAGEKVANPPMVAVKDAVRSDVNAYAGGITWADAEYDERLGEVLRPLTQDARGLPFGDKMRDDVKEMLTRAFFLNELSLPAPTESKEMTAFEAGQRVQEYIRRALPLFEPMEIEYNGAICELTFDVLMRSGAFGSPLDMPQSLRGQEIQFRFVSPLTEAVEKQKVQTFAETRAIIAEAVALDPSAGAILDGATALRDVLQSNGTPQLWLRSPEQIQAGEDQKNAAMAQEQLLSGMERGANVAKTIGEAGGALRDAGIGQDMGQAA